nr:MarR family transcriptional regulator [Actinopolymorpha cephalotaxi]
MVSIRAVAVKSPRWRTSRIGDDEVLTDARYIVVRGNRLGRVPTDTQYRQLLAFRNQLRRFDRWSREAAADYGLTHAQHQLLLAIRGSTTPGGPTIGEIADALLIKAHSAGELVDRLAVHGMVTRERDADDHRRVHLRLTEEGERTLAQLTKVHLAELRELAALMHGLPSDT